MRVKTTKGEMPLSRPASTASGPQSHYQPGTTICERCDSDAVQPGA